MLYVKKVQYLSYIIVLMKGKIIAHAVILQIFTKKNSYEN